MFVHGGLVHILFNMLTLWMFGVELERMWGTRFFTKFYFVCGIGAGLTQVLLGVLPLAIRESALSTRRRSAHQARSSGCCSPTRCTSRPGRS